MIRLKLFIFIFLLLGEARASNIIPVFPQDKYLLRSHLRYFHKKDKWLYQAEILHNSKIDNRVNHEYHLGFKYRFFDNLKAGLHLSRRYGLRHDDDWRSVNDEWRWEATNGRGENHFSIELSPRFAWRKFVGELRLKNEFNFFNDQNTLKIRPGLSYFVFHHGKPLITLFLQYEAHFPINYNIDGHNIREGWFWFGWLYHHNKNLKLGTYLAYRDMFWGTSQMFKDVIQSNYLANEKSWEIGLIVNILTFN